MEENFNIHLAVKVKNETIIVRSNSNKSCSSDKRYFPTNTKI